MWIKALLKFFKWRTRAQINADDPINASWNLGAATIYFVTFWGNCLLSQPPTAPLCGPCSGWPTPFAFHPRPYFVWESNVLLPRWWILRAQANHDRTLCPPPSPHPAFPVLLLKGWQCDSVLTDDLGASVFLLNEEDTGIVPCPCPSFQHCPEKWCLKTCQSSCDPGQRSWVKDQTSCSNASPDITEQLKLMPAASNYLVCQKNGFICFICRKTIFILLEAKCINVSDTTLLSHFF